MEMRGLLVLMIVAFCLGTRVVGQSEPVTQPPAVDIEKLTFFNTVFEPENWINLLNAMHVEESVLKACAQHAKNTRQQAKNNSNWCKAEWKKHKESGGQTSQPTTKCMANMKKIHADYFKSLRSVLPADMGRVLDQCADIIATFEAKNQSLRSKKPLTDAQHRLLKERREQSSNQIADLVRPFSETKARH